MDLSSYESYLRKPCDPEEIVRLSHVVFTEGHLELIDDLLVVIMPLANIIYYRYIKHLDDREYAKEDLISDALLRLYQDMTLRWDKYIHIESYYEYFSRVLRNGMLGLVHVYHNYYSMEEIDPEIISKGDSINTAFESVDLSILRDSISKSIITTAERILSCRCVNTNLLLNILRVKYVDKSSLDSLCSRVRVLGVSKSLFNFYVEHVTYVYELAFNYQYAILGGKDKMIERISKAISRFEDVTYRILSTNYYDSIIPEIYAEFGPDVAKKFVRTFSGRTVQVPDYKNFCDDLLGGVVLSLSQGDKNNLYTVAEEYGIPYRSLSRIYNKAIKYDNQ